MPTPDASGSRASHLERPPPPHDPLERRLLRRVDDWELRAYAEFDRKHIYFAPRGFLHVQFWHRPSRVSLLTPSRLTFGHYELFHPEAKKYRTESLEDLRFTLLAVHGLVLPGTPELTAIQRWHVERHERACRGGLATSAEACQ